MTGQPPSTGTQPTILFDVTELVVMDLRTGIQRVVRELLEHGLAGATPTPIVPVIAVGDRFHRLSEAGWARVRAPGGGVGEKRITHQRGVPPAVRLLKWAASFTPSFYNLLQRIYFGNVLKKRARGLYEPEPVRITPDHHLLLADSFWGGASTLRAAERAVAEGANLTVVVYDLIPLTHPQFCDARLVMKFKPLMTRAMAISDRVLAISEDCAKAFRVRFPDAEASAFRLGHDIREDVSSSTGDAAWPAELWSRSSRVFVIVGSIEPRKGHAAVLDAFERRWRRGEEDKLLVIGKVGWDVDALMHRLDHHHEAGRRLFHVHNATNAMLKEALQRAYAAIIASYIEGFGLPLVESLAAGLPVLASDIRVFHEIAQDSVLYFTPGDAEALDAAIDLLHTRHAEMARKAAEFTWPDWRAAAEDFFAKAEGRVASTRT